MSSQRQMKKLTAKEKAARNRKKTKARARRAVIREELTVLAADSAARERAKALGLTLAESTDVHVLAEYMKLNEDLRRAT